MKPWDTNLKELFDIILKASKEDNYEWSWSRTNGFGCKYVDIRIDMRDGGYILKNREGERISAEDLWKQGLEKERKEEE